MRRRDFLKTSTAGLVILATGCSPALRDDAPASNAAALPKRPYGKTGERLSIVGFSGLALARIDQDQTNRLVAWAVEHGCNYFDVAPAYGDAEIKLGPALEPYRKNVFLSTKTKCRDAEGAEFEFTRSLERLRTDHVDLYHLHCIQSPAADVQAVFAKGGAWEFISKARKDGRIRYVAFSAHTEEAALAALDTYDFDSFLLPINAAAWFNAGFGPKVLAKAAARGTQPIAIKPLARQAWTMPRKARSDLPFGRMWYQPISDDTERDLALRWALSKPITALMPPHDADLWQKAVLCGMAYRPIDDAGIARLEDISKPLNPLFPQKQS